MSKQHQAKSKKGVVPVWIFALLGILLLVAAYRLFAPSTAHAQHPEPRPAANADKIVPAARYAQAPEVARVYTMAARIPQMLDGLYCYCECSKHAGHRSLLSCFESDHGAMCDVCLGEAALAFRLSQEGKSLEDIRRAIDDTYSR